MSGQPGAKHGSTAARVQLRQRAYRTVAWNRRPGTRYCRALRTTGARFKLGALLRGAREYAVKDDKLVVKFAHSSHIDRINQEIDNPSVRQELRQALSRTMGGEYELVPELISDDNGSDTRRANQSHLVVAAQRMGARLVDKFEEEVEQ